MEDSKQRLQFDDVSVRSHCILKLANTVRKKAKGEVLTAASLQIPELNLLWETCADASSVTSSLAVQAIVSLVENNCINVKFAINTFLSCIKSAKNICALLKGLVALLILEFNTFEEKNKIPQYSLHYPKHPLISVLQEVDESLPLVLENMKEVLSLESKGFQMMEPVVCYIMSNPVPKEKSNCSKVLLLDSLMSHSDPKYLLHAFKLISFLQVKNFYQVAEVSLLIQKAYVLAKLNCDEKYCNYTFEFLLLAALAMTERCIICGHDPVALLSLSEVISKHLIKNNCSQSTAHLCLVLLTYILKGSAGLVREKLLNIGLELTKIKPVSPTVAAILAVSVIQVLPEPSGVATEKVALMLLQKLEFAFLQGQQSVDNNSVRVDAVPASFFYSGENDLLKYFESFTSLTESAMCCFKFALKLDECDSNFKLKWLKSVQEAVNCDTYDNANVIFSLVAALFLIPHENDMMLKACLNTLDAIISKNKNLSTRIFSLLLYKQNSVDEPHLKLMLLEYLPKSAVHKYAIPPVISILKAMACQKDLKSLAIHLMVQLWKKQDRCFPYLYKLLVELSKTTSSDTNVNEILLAQAAAIKEICLKEPEKHGKEFLGTLSTIFNESNDERSTPVACLALDGVIALCRSEIIDLRSTWKALSSRLSRDKRTVVHCKMYKLLELAPELKVKSVEYDKFMCETVGNIWKQISARSITSVTLRAAYKTLAKYPADCYVLKQLPQAAKENLKLPPSMKATPFEMGKLPEDVLTYIPGYCFIDLLRSMTDAVEIEGYTEFLQSLVQQEISDLPRSIYSQQKHFVKRKNTNEVLTKVPAFLCSQFHERKSPALQKNLAVGVLFCYEPPLEAGKDGQPLKRSIATQSRLYEDVLSVLLKEVNIDTSEWQRFILLPNAWGGFMERAFFAYEEARKAELELQVSHGHLHLTPEEMSDKCKSAWLWVRDRLLNLIKSNVKSTPTSHANAVFAVAGLVYALDKFYCSLEEGAKSFSDDKEEFVCHRVFQTEYTETVLCAFNPDYKPTGKVHSWLLIHLSRPNSSTSYLVQGCAASSVCLLRPVLTGVYVDEIPHLCQFLLQNLSHSSPVLSLYSGLGLGLFIKSLCEGGFADAGESQSDLLIKTSKSIMAIYNAENGPCSLICLTMSVVALSQVSNEEYKDWISSLCSIMHEKLEEESKSSMNFEMLSICVTAIMIAGAEGSCLPVQKIENLARWFDTARAESPQCSGISVSYGMLIEALDRFGHALGAELRLKVLKEWFNTLSSEKRPTLQRIAALNGLCSLFSHGRGLLQVKVPSSANSVSALNDLIPLMFQMITATRDTGLQNICFWEIGRLYAVHSNQQQNESSVSGSYSYLGEKSVLKPIMKLILDGHKTDETKPQTRHLLACLRALEVRFTRPLPPLNWVAILTPFLQEDENAAVKAAALKIAVHQSIGSSSAVNLVSSFCSPPLIHSLDASSFLMLVKNMPTLSAILPAAKLQVFLQTVILSNIKNVDNFKRDGEITLQVILDCLKQSGYKPQSLKVIHDAFISILKHFMKDPQQVQNHLPWIADGFTNLPEQLVNSILSVSKKKCDVSVLTLIWCYLVKVGKKQLLHLRPCIEEAKQSSTEERELMCAYLYECFLNGTTNSESDLHQPTNCISWLLETIGWIKVLEDSKSKYQLITTAEVHRFLVDVCSAVVIGCSGLESSFNFLPVQRLDHFMLFQNLPIAIGNLFQKNEWCTNVDKILDWLLMLLKSQYLNEKEKEYIKMCLCSMRGFSEFHKSEIWTDVICRIESQIK